MEQQESLNRSIQSNEALEPEVFPVNNIQDLQQSLVNIGESGILEKLKNYAMLDSDERIKIAKNISVMYEQLPPQDRNLNNLKANLIEIMKDKEIISKELLHQIPEVEHMLAHHNSQVNKDNPQAHLENIKSILIPVLIGYLNFAQLQIKEEAGKHLGALVHKLNDNDRGDFVLKHVIQMAHDDANEQNRIVAVQLFSNMSQCFGRQLCEQFIGLEILSLGEDTSFKVRKEAIKHLPVICRLVSKPFFKRLFQFYVEKAKDQTNWAIRKACVEVVIEMAEMCEPLEKESYLTEIMLILLKDTNKWVRVSAYKNLGRFIYELKGLKLSDKLVAQFCKMVDNDINSLGKDNEIIYSCAYNFPAVLDSLGKARWETDLWKVYEKLLKCPDKKVKKTLSQSLHEIAKLIGESLTEKYLFAVVDMFFKDKNDDIKLGTIRNMSGIMSVLSYEKRQSLIGVFEEFQKDQKKWRIREVIGKQLGNILQIYSPDTIFEYVVPILFKFCSDSVSIVREEAAMKVGDFITKFEDPKAEHFLPGLIQSVKGFGSSPKYTQRQSFLIMCKKLMNHKELFMKNFMDIMQQMKADKVVNVKLLLAQTVKEHIQSKGPLSEEQSLLALREALRQDEEQEVRDIFEEE